MGSYDSAQVADLIRIYILDTLGRIVNIEQVGLYQGDGIIFIPSSNGPYTSKIQKIIRAFKLIGLRIEIASNLKIVVFLDVTLNLNNGTFKPYCKSNSVPTFINIDSNHPRTLLKQIPNAVNQRINWRSSCKIIFEESKSVYDEALKNSGFQGRLEYVNPMNSGSNRRSNSSGTHTLVQVGDANNYHPKIRGKNRNRRVIWFNPSFCKLTNINIGKFFLNLLDKHFNRDNPLRRISKRNAVKISYSCTNNIHSILNNHNRRLLDELKRNSGGPDEVSCNCRRKRGCPLGERCNSKNVVYQACISPMKYDNNGEKVYIGISTGNWKQGLYNYRHSFSNPRLRNQTALSKYFWNLKDQGLTPPNKGESDQADFNCE